MISTASAALARLESGVVGEPVRYFRGIQREADSCLICGMDNRLCSDHCHWHGWVRGTLCYTCNQDMTSVDAGRMPRYVMARWSADDIHKVLMRYFVRCPDCPKTGGLREIRRRFLRGQLFSEASTEETLLDEFGPQEVSA